MLKLLGHETIVPAAYGGVAGADHAYRVLTDRGEEVWSERLGDRTQGSKVYGPDTPFPDGRKHRITEARIGGWHGKEHGLQSNDAYQDIVTTLNGFFGLFRMQLIPGKLAFAYQSRDGGPWLYAELLGVPAKFDPYTYEDTEDCRVWCNVWPNVNVWLKHAWGDRLGLWLEVLSPDAQHTFAFRVIGEQDGKEVLPKGILTASQHVTNPTAIAALTKSGLSKVRVLDHGQCKVTEFLAWDRTGKRIATEGYSYKSGERLQSIPVQPASAYPLVLDTDVTEQVAASGDDGFVDNVYDGFYPALSYLAIGRYYDGSDCAWTRFTTVAVDQGATIGDNAELRYKASETRGIEEPTFAHWRSRIYGNDDADPDAPTDRADYNGKVLTTANTDWNEEAPTGWTKDSWYPSPSITGILQEIVDIELFASGNPIQVLHKENGSQLNLDSRLAYTYDSDAANAPYLVFAWSAGGGPQTITCNGIATGLAFGSAAVSPGAVNIAATGIASAAAYGSAAITTGAVTITATGLESAAAVGEPAIGQVVKPEGIASTQGIGEPALTVGPVTIEATGIASAEAVGEPTVTPGTVNIEAQGIPSAEVVGEPAVSVGPVTIQTQSIASQEAFGSAVVTTGAVNIAATGIESGAAIGEPAVVQVISTQGIASGEAVGEPALTVGAVDIGATGIESGITFGEAAIGVGAVDIAANGIPSGTVFGSPAVGVGAVDIAASGIESAVQFGEAQVKQIIAAQGIASGTAFGSANVGVGAVGIVAAGIASGVQFGDATVTPGAVDIAAQGIESAVQFGSASVQVATQFIEATGIEPAAAFGEASVTPGPVTVQAAGIESAAAVGEPSVAPGAVAIVAEGIASQAAVGEPAITVGAVEIQASGIESGVAFGEAAVSPGPVAIAASGIPSSAAVGEAQVTPGPVEVVPTGIESTAAFGSAEVAVGPVNVAAQGVPSSVAFGEAQVTPGPVSIVAEGIPSAAAIGSAEVAPGPVGIQADGIPSAIAVGSAAVVPGPVEIAAQGIESGVAFGQAAVEGAPVVISAQGIASGTMVGNPTVQPGPVNISAQGIGSAAAFGAPAITCLVTITASGIPSGAAIGSLTVTPGPVNITATGIASGVQFGSARVAHPMPLPLRCLGRIRLRAGDDKLLLTTHGRIRLKAVIGVSTTVELTVGQTYPIIEITAVDADGSAIDWTGWDSVVFYLANRAGTLKINGTAAEFVSPRTGGKLRYTMAAADVDTAGVYYGQFKATDGTSIAYVPSNPNDAIKVVIGARVGS